MCPPLFPHLSIPAQAVEWPTDDADERNLARRAVGLGFRGGDLWA